MGTVYEALDQRVNCIVALKETIAGKDSEAKRAFEREASLLANLRHSTLPKVMDYFTEGQGDFLVMEFISGHDLAELLDLRGGPFPQPQVLRWADDLLNVLEYLHGKQLLHRDIKPSNLKLTKEGEIFLLDFGLAKGAVGQMPTLATSHSVRGYTPVYASLEQILNQGTDARSDIYSLGATLYHLLTGTAPIDAPTRFHVTEEEQRDPLALIQNENPHASPHVAAIIHSAMEISRKRRPASAAEMRKALRSAEEEEAQSRDQMPATVRAASVPGVVPPENKAPSSPGIRSMPSSSPTGGSFGQFSGRPNELFAAASTVRSTTTPRTAIVGVVILAVLVGIAILIWFWKDTTSQDVKSVSQATPESTLPRSQPNQAGIEFVLISPGTFFMDSKKDEGGETPVHQVTISYSFYMGKYEVTQAQWQAVMGNNPSSHKSCGGNCPVEQVSWDDVQNFINKLNESNNGFIYRLPTDAEWEYACRAGTTGHYAGNLSDMAWYWENSGQETHATGSKQANAWGLADMHGNVWEWCEDWYHESYEDAPTNGSAWLTDGPQKHRVMRGGSSLDEASDLRSSSRGWATPNDRLGNVGFRVVAVPRTQQLEQPKRVLDSPQAGNSNN
jgi:formylglycine-generating enzyme required for sulfatase activity